VPPPPVLVFFLLFFGLVCAVGNLALEIVKEALSLGALVTLIARSSAKLEKAIDRLVDNKTISADRISKMLADVGDYETLTDAIEQSFQWRAIRQRILSIPRTRSCHGTATQIL
jgi:putative NADH-flavin reductase